MTAECQLPFLLEDQESVSLLQQHLSTYINEFHKVHCSSQAESSPACIQIGIGQDQDTGTKSNHGTHKVHPNTQPTVAHPEKVKRRVVVVHLGQNLFHKPRLDSECPNGRHTNKGLAKVTVQRRLCHALDTLQFTAASNVVCSDGQTGNSY